MSKLTLFAYSPSNNCLRVEVALKEKKLEYERIEIDIFKGQQKTPKFLAMNPRGTVPCLTHGSIVLQDSMAAIQYLDMAFPDQVPLTPQKPAQMASCIQYIHEFEQSFNPKNVAYQVFFGNQKKAQLEAEIEALLEEVALWDGYLKRKEYLVGDFTLADIAVFPLVSQRHSSPTLNDKDGSPRARLARRASFATTADAAGAAVRAAHACEEEREFKQILKAHDRFILLSDKLAGLLKRLALGDTSALLGVDVHRLAEKIGSDFSIIARNLVVAPNPNDPNLSWPAMVAAARRKAEKAERRFKECQLAYLKEISHLRDLNKLEDAQGCTDVLQDVSFYDPISYLDTDTRQLVEKIIEEGFKSKVRELARKLLGQRRSSMSAASIEPTEELGEASSTQNHHTEGASVKRPSDGKDLPCEDCLSCRARVRELELELARMERTHRQKAVEMIKEFDDERKLLQQDRHARNETQVTAGMQASDIANSPSPGECYSTTTHTDPAAGWLSVFGNDPRATFYNTTTYSSSEQLRRTLQESYAELADLMQTKLSLTTSEKDQAFIERDAMQQNKEEAEGLLSTLEQEVIALEAALRREKRKRDKCEKLLAEQATLYSASNRARQNPAGAWPSSMAATARDPSAPAHRVRFGPDGPEVFKTLSENLRDEREENERICDQNGELKEENRKLRLTLNEMQVRLQRVRTTASRSRVARDLNEIIKRSGLEDFVSEEGLPRHNVFSRLYDDAVNRVRKLEALSKKIIQEEARLLNRVFTVHMPGKLHRPKPAAVSNDKLLHNSDGENVIEEAVATLDQEPLTITAPILARSTADDVFESTPVQKHKFLFVCEDPDPPAYQMQGISGRRP
ncbi:glutathione Stransferase [Perkinsus olseni]|uniref:Glutathione Stransferase n=1 Tax=Perkinsus olseni TaxID=32597 RepID=A0A7J6LEP2_PEROL|nr:glutathione Stransferase [Perkinsus olseni]KAF4662055.1 glutathione Stransferase [Perkinsus olseni]